MAQSNSEERQHNNFPSGRPYSLFDVVQSIGTGQHVHGITLERNGRSIKMCQVNGVLMEVIQSRSPTRSETWTEPSSILWIHDIIDSSSSSDEEELVVPARPKCPKCGKFMPQEVVQEDGGKVRVTLKDGLTRVLPRHHCPNCDIDMVAWCVQQLLADDEEEEHQDTMQQARGSIEDGQAQQSTTDNESDRSSQD